MYILADCDSAIIEGSIAMMSTNTILKSLGRNLLPRKKEIIIRIEPETADGNLNAHSDCPKVQTDNAIKYDWPIPLG